MAEPSRESDRQPGMVGKAMASLSLGLFLFVFWIPVWKFAGDYTHHIKFFIQSFLIIASGTAIFAIIYGRQVKAACAQGHANSAARITAAIGRVFGYLSLATIFVFLVGGFFARRFVENARRDGSQYGAVKALKDINVAAKTYASAYGHGFPATLASLGPPKPTDPSRPPQPNEKAAGLIEDDFSQGLRSSYHFIYAPGVASGDGSIPAYTIHADPLPGITTARNHYFSDQSGVIRVEEGKSANEHSKPVN